MTKEERKEVRHLIVSKIHRIQIEVEDLEKLIFQELLPSLFLESEELCWKCGVFLGYINTILNVLDLIKKTVKYLLKG